MRQPFIALTLAIAIAASGSAAPAMAGRSCASHRVTVGEMRSAVDLADAAQRALGAGSATVALIARVGSDLSDYGLTYTHVAIARRDATDGVWRVIRQLNPCGSTQSVLRHDGLGTFMLDDLLTHDLLVATLEPEFATELAGVLDSDLPRRLHEPRYNMVAYPGPPARYQNSNQWVLELLALAQARRLGEAPRSRADAQATYRQLGYRGTTIRISGLRRSMAETFSGSIRFDDHPQSSLERGRYEVVSVRSIVDYLQRSGVLTGSTELVGGYRRADRPDLDAAREPGAANTR